ncbi:hypothetical protein AB6H46_22325 [Vibrio alginolyticus]|uniref:hypothetical protein n=1 Tax=Vibrio alginolyticus TaxID=663 RepID=UPI001DD76047|nr:hypothetical protein [Vibrio alginolyticus]
MKVWQKIELSGAICILLSIFLQFFVSAGVEQSMKTSDAEETNMRLEHIYYYIKHKEERNPSWEMIEEMAKGKRVEGDNHWRFEEVYYFLTPASILLFFLGSVIGVIGRCLEYREINRTA